MSTDTKATHTPGPWRDEPITTAQSYRMRGPLPQDFLIAGHDGTCVGILYDYMNRAPANARLIAAAPELLAALTITHGQWIHSVHAAQCLAAIAKATGEPVTAEPLCIHGRDVCGICAESQQ